MRTYRISPWDPHGAPGQLFDELGAARPHQRSGRFDNPAIYAVLYLSLSQSGAVAEVLGNHTAWNDELFDHPATGRRRHLLTLEVDGAVADAVVDLDDAQLLANRGLRPSEVVGRSRTRTRTLAADLFAEGAPGVRFWSYYRPEWTNLALFVPPVRPHAVTVVDAVEMDVDLPCVAAASEMLCRRIRR